jgi:hypothetical protein
MNDADFENNLRDLLQPARPSADLQQRIRQQLQRTDARPGTVASGRLSPAPRPGLLFRLLRDFGWACAGAAVVLAVLAFWPGRQTPPASVVTQPPQVEPLAATLLPATATAANTAAFEHDGTTNELVATQNSDELVETDDGPAREVRYSYVERHAWSNPSTGARVVLEVPREDVYLLPVSLQ